VLVQAIVAEEIVQLLDRAQPVHHFGEKTELSECGLDSVGYSTVILTNRPRSSENMALRDIRLEHVMGNTSF
jgi:hypothetical protein